MDGIPEDVFARRRDWHVINLKQSVGLYEQENINGVER